MSLSNEREKTLRDEIEGLTESIKTLEYLLSRKRITHPVKKFKAMRNLKEYKKKRAELEKKLKRECGGNDE